MDKFVRGDTISGLDYFWVIEYDDKPIFVKGFVYSTTSMTDNPEDKIYRMRNIVDGNNYRIEACSAKSCRLLLIEKLRNEPEI